QRPRHDIVGDAGRKRVDDGDRMRGKSFLRECRCGRERARGGGDEETTAVHALPFEAGPQTTLTFAHRGCPASQVQTSAQGQTDTGHRKSAVVCPRADATPSGQDTRRLLAQIRHYKVLQLEGGWAGTDVMQRADVRSKRRAVSIA